MRKFAAALIDVDGTLRHHDDYNPGALELLNALNDAGVAIALCSGRTVQSLEATASELPMVSYVAGGSGSAAQKRTPSGWVSIGERHLSDAAVAEVLARAKAADMEAWLYTADAWYVESTETPMVRQDMAMTAARPTVGPLDGVPQVIKMLLFATNPAQDAVLAELRADPQFHLVSSFPGYYDIVHADSAATKGGDFILDDLGAAWAGTIAIGDGENDLGMLSRAGVGICIAPLSPDALDPAQPGQRRTTVPGLVEALAFIRES